MLNCGVRVGKSSEVTTYVGSLQELGVYRNTKEQGLPAVSDV